MHRIAVAAAILFSFLPRAFAANGASPIAVGAAAQGRGGADTALALDGSAIHTNPAGLTSIRGDSLDLYLGVARPHLEFKTTRDSASYEAVSVVPGLAWVHELWRPGTPADGRTAQGRAALPPSSRWRVGLGIYPLMGGEMHMNVGSEFWSAVPGLPAERPRYGGRTAIVEVGPAVAVRLWGGLSLGAGLAVHLGQTEQEAPVEAPISALQGKPTGLLLLPLGQTFEKIMINLGQPTLKGKADLSGASASGFGGRLGLVWRVHPQLRIGASYSQTLSMSDFQGEAVVDFSRQIDVALNELQGLQAIGRIALENEMPDVSRGYKGNYKARVQGLQAPRVIAAGVALFPRPGWVLTADVKRIEWSGGLNVLKIKLTEGDNPNLNVLTGSDHVEADLPIGWQDQWVVAAGVEAPVSGRLRLRAGWNYGGSPVPEDRLQPTHLGLMEHHVTLGLGWTGAAWSLNLAIEHAFPGKAESTDNTANADLSGSSGSASMDAVAMGVSYRY